MNKTIEIALLVKTNADWHRSVLMGAAQYSEDMGGWNFTIPPADSNGEVFLPEDWNGDGVICRITSEELEASLLEKDVPAVNISWLSCSTGQIPRVNSDQRACSSLAARFLIEKQYENYGYIGFPPWSNYSELIEETFQTELDQHGHRLHRFQLSPRAKRNHGINTNELTRWLVDLPKPVALVVWDSIVGQHVVSTCIANNLDVPGSVAVLCIEHDPLWSALAPVPISNIDQDPWRVGFNAAKLLHQMIRGDQNNATEILIPPISIVQRRSTEASSVKDPILDKAIKYIYDHAKTGITVKDLLDFTEISRRGLETRFKQELNCSPAAFIRRIQLQSVARLLRTTSWTISSIAQRTGFAYPEVLMRAFKREFGVTPMQFRGAGSAKGTTPSIVCAKQPRENAVDH